MPTNFTIGDWELDHILYNEDADVMYLSIGEPRRARVQEFCGLTLMGV